MSKPSADVFLKFVSKIIEENEFLTQLIKNVYDLHEDSGLGTCAHCSYRPYPCPTILALEVRLDA